jgi:hypothetical protein
MKKKYSTADPYFAKDFSSCLRLKSVNGRTYYLAVDAAQGLEAHELEDVDFKRIYSLAPKYPGAKLAKLYVGYARQIGGTEEALNALRTVIDVSDEDYDMAIQTRRSGAAKKAPVKKAVAKKAPVKKAVAKKAPVKKAVAKKAPVKKAVAKKAPVKKAVAKKAPVKKAVAKKATSASSMFCELIMEGKLTDNEIFETVQKEFGLDNKKRGYVGWYRNNLKKKGENPPGPK